MQPSEVMADSRKPYPKGRKLLVTDEWLERVDAALAANKALGRSPSSRAELVEMVANKSSMSMLWGTKSKKRSQTSKLVEPISALLGLDSEPTDAPHVARSLNYEDEVIRRNLVAFRKERGLSIEQVIETVGIDVTDFENGAAIPASKLGKLADLYWHSVDDFRLAEPPKADRKRARGVYLQAEPDVDFPREEYERIQKQIDEARARWLASNKTKKS